MKHLNIFLLIFPFFITAFSQDTINMTDVYGLKVGFWRKLDSTGKKIYEGRFSKGIPQGTFTHFYPSGKVKVISDFSEDGKKSKTTTYFESGKKMAVGNYIDEKRDGIWQFFSEYDQALLSEESYRNGKKDGISKTYYAGKGTAELVTWKEGIKEGSWIQYYSDGGVKMKTFNRNGMKHGLIEAFSEKKIMIFSGNYAEGEPDGIWLFFDDKGTIVKKEVYDKGALVSSEETKSTP